MIKMYKFCAPYMKKYKSYIFLYYLFVIICGILNLIVPIVNGKIIDYISASQKTLLWYAIKCFLIVNLLFILMNFAKNRTYIKAQTNVAFNIISKLLSHFQQLPINVIDTLDVGSLNQKINSDSNSITAFIINLAGNFIVNTITTFFSIYILIDMNYIIGITMLGVGCLYILIYLLLKKIIYVISFKLKEEQASFFSAMLMQLQNIKFVKIHSLISEYHEKMNTRYHQYYESVVKSQSFFFAYSSLDSIITIITNIFVFILGGSMVMDKKISIGEFTIIFSYFNFIVTSFKYFSSLAKDYQENKVSYERLIKLFDIKKQSEGKMEISEIKSITCKNLSFVRNSKKLFINFNYDFMPGKIYCICGENGRGKTTLIETIIGIHQDEYTGQILYNGIDIADINMFKLRYNNISVMEQHLVLLEGDLHDNICLSSKYSFDNINSLIGINISTIQNRLQSFGKINNNGSGISGGESQKLGLYRLFAKNSEVYILDEPTISLDQDSVKTFMEYIHKIKKDKIVIIISHNPTTIDMCDCIINL